MHSSTVLAVALVAFAAPALSVPFIVRDTAAAPDQSGALNTGLIKDVVSIGNDVITGAQSIKNLFTGNQRREFEDLLVRQAIADAELVSRSLGDDASGALLLRSFNFKPPLINECDVGCIQQKLFPSTFVQNLQREDMVELLARDNAADASGALNVGKIISTVASFLKREAIEELLARDVLARSPLFGTNPIASPNAW